MADHADARAFARKVVRAGKREDAVNLAAAYLELRGLLDAAYQGELPREHERRFGPCFDSATLLATTTGSPSDQTCPNIRHRMRVEIKTTPSNEEIGALVFCECRRDADGGVR